MMKSKIHRFNDWILAYEGRVSYTFGFIAVLIGFYGSFIQQVPSAHIAWVVGLILVIGGSNMVAIQKIEEKLD